MDINSDLTLSDLEENELTIVQPKYNNYMDILQNYEDMKKLNKSRPILTKYERTKVIGVRAQQIAGGAEPLIKVPPGLYDVIDIAERELKEKKTPFIVKRTINNNFEYWKIEDLEILN